MDLNSHLKNLEKEEKNLKQAEEENNKDKSQN